jgi:hypothetical protein
MLKLKHISYGCPFDLTHLLFFNDGPWAIQVKAKGGNVKIVLAFFLY